MSLTLTRMQIALFLLMILGPSLGTGCASAPAAPEPTVAAPPPVTAKVPEDNFSDRELMSKMQDRIQDLETRLSALNEKINIQNGVQNTTNEIPTQVIQKPVAASKGIPAKAGVSAAAIAVKKQNSKKLMMSEEPAESSDEAIDRFREAKIMFDSKKYSDAVVEFSEFIKNEPHHALAPAAQYYLGMGYFKQKEFQLAEEELNRGVISYPHSNYIPDYLLALTQVSVALKKTEKANYYQQKLLSSFPNSPQAKSIDSTQSSEEPEVVKPAIDKTVDKTIENAADKMDKMMEAPSVPTAPMSPTAPAAPEENATQPGSES